MESHEPPRPDPVKVSAGTHQALVEWSEEERRNVVTFFTLLDQWDRQLSEKKGAA